MIPFIQPLAAAALILSVLGFGCGILVLLSRPSHDEPTGHETREAA
jgi:hypothetical protein